MRIRSLYRFLVGIAAVVYGSGMFRETSASSDVLSCVILKPGELPSNTQSSKQLFTMSSQIINSNLDIYESDSNTDAYVKCTEKCPKQDGQLTYASLNNEGYQDFKPQGSFKKDNNPVQVCTTGKITFFNKPAKKIKKTICKKVSAANCKNREKFKTKPRLEL